MVLGSTLLTTNDAITKWLTQEYPVSQVWCLRTVFVLVLITLLAPRYGGYRALMPNQIPAQLLRAVLFFSTTLLIVTGLSLLPLAQMVAIVFGSPIFVAALAPIVLRERVDGVRWLVIGIGFVGVLFILRPDPTMGGAASIITCGCSLKRPARPGNAADLKPGELDFDTVLLEPAGGRYCSTRCAMVGLGRRAAGRLGLVVRQRCSERRRAFSHYRGAAVWGGLSSDCLLYTSDAADE